MCFCHLGGGWGVCEINRTYWTRVMDVNKYSLSSSNFHSILGREPIERRIGIRKQVQGYLGLSVPVTLTLSFPWSSTQSDGRLHPSVLSSRPVVFEPLSLDFGSQ